MKIQLNFNKPDNYAFFCPVSKVHLTRSNPVVTIDEVTPYIKRGLKSKVIIEITDNTEGQEPTTDAEPKKQDVETQPMSNQEESASSIENEETVNNEEIKSEEENEEAVSEEETKAEEEIVEEETKEEAPAPKKRGRKGSK